LAEVAKGLARRMAYADIIRVAQLKTRPGRLAELAGRAGMNEVVSITEYFRPGLFEICDILPVAIATRILAWAQAKPKRSRLSWPMALRSTTVTGFLSLKFLAALRPLRRASYRYQVEQAAIDVWLADIATARGVDAALALEVAKNARLIKGYGDTHMRTQMDFEAIRNAVVAPALQGSGDAHAVAAARDKALAARPSS